MMKLRHSICLLFAFLGSVAFAQGGNIIGGDNTYLNPQKYTIAGVRVSGVPYYDESAIVLISGLTVGKEITIPGEDISNAIKKLWEQELFSDIQILMDGEPKINGDVYLIIQVEGRPKISRYKFAPNGQVSKSEADKIREIIDIYSGKIITESLIKNTENIVRGFYQEKGYLRTVVKIDQVQDTAEFNQRELIITVEKGEKIKIG